MSQTSADVKILFVAQTDSGVLAKASNTRGNEYMTASVERRMATYNYDFGGGDNSLVVREVTLAQNQSYWFHIQRSNSWAQVSLDKLYVEATPRYEIQHVAMNYDKSAFFLGAPSRTAQGPDDFQGTVKTLLIFSQLA